MAPRPAAGVLTGSLFPRIFFSESQRTSWKVDVRRGGDGLFLLLNVGCGLACLAEGLRHLWIESVTVHERRSIILRAFSEYPMVVANVRSTYRA